MIKIFKLLIMIAAVTLVSLAGYTVIHEYTHQHTASEYGCEYSEIKSFLLGDGNPEVPAYVTWNCDDPETFERVKDMQQIADIVGYHNHFNIAFMGMILIVFLFVNKQQTRKLERIKRNQAFIAEKVFEEELE